MSPNGIRLFESLHPRHRDELILSDYCEWTFSMIHHLSLPELNLLWRLKSQYNSWIYKNINEDISGAAWCPTLWNSLSVHCKSHQSDERFQHFSLNAVVCDRFESSPLQEGTPISFGINKVIFHFSYFTEVHVPSALRESVTFLVW